MTGRRVRDERGVALGLAVILVAASGVRSDNTPKIRFSATLGEELEIEVGLG